MNAPLFRIVYHSGPDEQDRCHFTLYWFADYHPGHPAGEYRHAERAQCFHADPRPYGFAMPDEKELTASTVMF